MPTFNFSLIKTKSDKKKTSNKEVIKKNIKGVIWINKEAIYSVRVEDSFYPIDIKCYSCKGKGKIYRQGEYDKTRVVYIRHNDSYSECNPNFWLPFSVGCIVSGDLINNNFSKVFIIKDCYVDVNDKISHEAVSYYREHLKEINDIIRKRREK